MCLRFFFKQHTTIYNYGRLILDVHETVEADPLAEVPSDPQENGSMCTYIKDKSINIIKFFN